MTYPFATTIAGPPGITHNSHYLDINHDVYDEEHIDREEDEGVEPDIFVPTFQFPDILYIGFRILRRTDLN